MFPEDELNHDFKEDEVSSQEAPIEEPRAEHPAEPQREMPRQPRSPYSASPYQAPQGYQVPPQSGYYYAPPQPKPPRKHSGKGFRRVAAFLLVAIMVAGGCFVTAETVNARNRQQLQELQSQIASLHTQLDSLPAASAAPGLPLKTGEVMTPAEVYAQNVDSVVGISCTVRTTSYGRPVEGTASGSGFVLTQDGYVVTNYHVIDGATEIHVVTNNGEKLQAEVVGQDITNDVAVLKCETDGLSPAALGSSAALSIGDMVVAIGNPLGTLNATQTVGYVSGKDRQVTTDNTVINMIQTDAAINSGNSGGPLFNMRGEVVGITTAKYSGSSGSGASIEGIGFAIPIDDVQSVISDLKDFGYVTGAYLGVTVSDTDPQTAEYYGLPTGAYVESVVPGGAADEAGIHEKDIIIRLGDATITNRSDLIRALRKYKAGDETGVTVVRGSSQVDLTIILAEKPADLNQPTKPQTTEPAPSEGSYDEWYDYFRKYFGIE